MIKRSGIPLLKCVRSEATKDDVEPYHCDAAGSPAVQCPVNSYCPAGAVAPLSCPANTAAPAGSDNIIDCVALAGYFVFPPGKCPASEANLEFHLVITSIEQRGVLYTYELKLHVSKDGNRDLAILTGTAGTQCPANSYCPATSTAPLSCPAQTTSVAGSAAVVACTAVAGYYVSTPGMLLSPLSTFSDWRLH